GHNLLVACALVSITLNPLLFRLLGPMERSLQRHPRLWRLANRRAQRREGTMDEQAEPGLGQTRRAGASLVGCGPVGQTVDTLLRASGHDTVVVDMNMDTVERLTREGRAAMYGDATNIEVMHAALERASDLVVTLPQATN